MPINRQCSISHQPTHDKLSYALPFPAVPSIPSPTLFIYFSNSLHFKKNSSNISFAISVPEKGLSRRNIIMSQIQCQYRFLASWFTRICLVVYIISELVILTYHFSPTRIICIPYIADTMYCYRNTIFLHLALKLA